MAHLNFNPRLDTLIKSLEYIKEHNPTNMDKIPGSHTLGYQWLWAMRDKMGLIGIRRSFTDGRVHETWITDKGLELLKLLKKLKDCQYVNCAKCNKPLDRFYRIPNKKWEEITGDLKDEAICRVCFKKMAKERGIKL